MPPRPPQFFFSIITALVTGVGVAYITIFGIQFFNSKPQSKDAHSMSFGIAIQSLEKTVEKTATQSLSKVSYNFRTFTALFSEHLVYEAQAEEDVGDDMTFTGENLTAAVSSSNGGISASSYIVQSLDKDNILVEKDSEKLLPIASVTKLITAVVAKKVFTDNDIIIITQKALNTEGSTGKFRLNEKYKVKEIMFPLLMVSSNDAAVALAEAYDATHGKGSFVKEMNNWAGEIGAYRTYFRDSSGLSPLNVSTARDLAIIAKWIKENMPEIFETTLTKSKTIRNHTWVNPTHFLSLASYSGGKNGYIPEASLTNVSLFELGSPKRLYSVVVLGSNSRDKDTLTVLNKAVK